MKYDAKKLFRWGLLLCSIGFIIFFFSRNRQDLQLLASIDLLWVALLIFLCLMYFVLHGYRNKIVLEKCGEREIGFVPWFPIFILGSFLNTVVPQVGNVYRSVRLKKEFQISYTRYISGFFSFAWLDTCFNLLLGLAVIKLFSPELRIGPLLATQLVLALFVLLAGAPIFSEILFRTFTVQGDLFSWLHSKFSEILTVSVSTLRDGLYMLKFFFLGVLVLLEACLILYVCFQSMEIHVGMAELVVFYVLLKFGTHVNITPGNIGVQEIFFGILSYQFEIGMGEGMLVSALLRAASYITLFALAAPMGGFGLLRESMRTRSDSQIT